jgi:Alpha/beta hydrolase
MVTFQQLRAADPAGWHEQAAAWRTLGTALDQRGKDLMNGYRPLLADWVGADADAAVARVTALRGELFAASDRIAPIADALDRHAEQVAAAQSRLNTAVFGSLQSGLVVHPDGSVTPSPAGLFQPGAPGRARALTAEIASIIATVSDSDARTAEALRAMAPVPDPTAPAVPTVPAASVPGAGTPASVVAHWWSGLGNGARESLVFSQPALIGNLDGVPAAFRDRANRAGLAVARAALTRHAATISASTPASAQPAALAGVRAQLAGLDAITRRLGGGRGAAPAYLLGLDTRGAGHAIVALGDPDRAEHVLTYVPGTGAGLADMGRAMRRGDTLLGAAGRANGATRTSVITWAGYDAPPDADAARDQSYAVGGEASLKSFQDGLRATHVGPAAPQVMLGEGYGSTVIGGAAVDIGLRADAMVFTNSPGVVALHAGQLGIDPSRVWAERDHPDPLGWTATQGPDPASPAFGARPLPPSSLDDAIARITVTTR